MISFFSLLSTHRSFAVIDRRNELLATAPALLSEGSAAVLACRLETRPDLLFITAATEEPLRFSLHPHAAQKTTAMLFRCTGGHRIALMHPFSGQFVTAPPEAHAPLVNSADSIKSWEQFELVALPPRMICQRVLDRLNPFETFFRSPQTIDTLLALIASGDEVSDLLNALLPVLPTPLLDQFASACLEDSALAASLAEAFPGNPWAQAALPTLHQWCNDTGKEQPAPSSDLLKASEIRDIGPELDDLGRVGLTGAFASFPHATVLRARRQILPRRKIAMLATARNEGIYLLEWLAYHRCLGVEAFYLYSNDNDDGSDELLQALAEAGVITWVNNRLDRSRGHAQFKSYGHALGFMPDLLDFEWTLVIDLDELLVLDRSLFTTLGDFCDLHRDRGAESISINWAFIRSEEIPVRSGLPLSHRNQRLLTEAQMGEGVRLVKSMSRSNRVCHSEAHVAFGDERSGLARFHAAGQEYTWHKGARGFPHSPKFSDKNADDTAVVYHYIYKSAEEWLWKNARNPGGHAITSNSDIRPMNPARAKSFLTQHNATDLQVTRRAALCAPGQIEEIRALKRLPGIADIDQKLRLRYAEKLAWLKTIYTNSAAVSEWSDDAKLFLKIAGIV